MLKLIGSACVASGGLLAWYLQRMERKRRQDTLSDFQRAFRRMGEEVRMARTPLPALLNRLAADCGPEASAFFQTAAEAAGDGGDLPGVWRRRAEVLNRVCSKVSIWAFSFSRFPGRMSSSFGYRTSRKP